VPQPLPSPPFYAGCPSWHNPPYLSWLGTGTEYAGLHKTAVVVELSAKEGMAHLQTSKIFRMLSETSVMMLASDGQKSYIAVGNAFSVRLYI